MTLDRTRNYQQDESRMIESEFLGPSGVISKKEPHTRVEFVQYENRDSEVLNNVIEDADRKVIKADMHGLISLSKNEDEKMAEISARDIWGQSMEYEIYKAANTIQSYSKVGFLNPEKRIPKAILRDARGLAILTIVKVGVMVTYNIGTGLVISRSEDGSWSPPSAISSFGIGWGAQAGGELTDYIIVLRTDDAVKTFTDDTQLSVGAGLSAAVGIVGRTAEASLRACTRGYAACYTYSCSKGAFIGCSLEGSIVTTRAKENSRFYGSQSITASDILLGSLPRPPAASMLYRALGSMYEKL